MKIKTRAKTIDIRFDNRRESIAFMRAAGFVNIAAALQAVEDRELAKLASSAGTGTAASLHEFTFDPAQPAKNGSDE